MPNSRTQVPQSANLTFPDLEIIGNFKLKVVFLNIYKSESFEMQHVFTFEISKLSSELQHIRI
jgi:hypothetical protein